ncbi:MAG: ATP-binding cassette domain-containing protein [Alphaproteobacteria bacterium]|nr:ATP-binding cassette domain-containing protein [Alphaproteobacteria bacterium]
MNGHYTFTIPTHTFYPDSTQSFVVAEQVFHLQKSKWTALMGPSGTGKTTLIRFMAGLNLQKPLSSIIHNIAFLSPGDRLLPWLSVEKNIGLSDLLQKKSINRQRINQILTMMGMEDSPALFPHQLSTGMERRVLLSRSLYLDRPILFLDEPFANLDTVTKNDILILLKKNLTDKTILFITHDAHEAEHADHIFTLKGRPAKIYPFVKEKDIAHV